jgi:hypothetical protein
MAKLPECACCCNAYLYLFILQHHTQYRDGLRIADIVDRQAAIDKIQHLETKPARKVLSHANLDEWEDDGIDGLAQNLGLPDIQYDSLSD